MKISLKYSESDAKSMNAKVLVGEQVYKFGNGEKDNVVFDLSANEIVEIKIEVNVLERTNYPLNLELLVSSE